MNARRPALAQFLFHGAAGKIQPCFVKKCGLKVRIRDDDLYRGCIGHTPKALFAFTEHSLRFIECRGVLPGPAALQEKRTNQQTL